jgi:8-oxo-dGTP diphosphatase
MRPLSGFKIRHLNNADPQLFSRACVGCLVLSKDKKIILQQRDLTSPTFPGCLATFGGGIESNESPIDTLVRELKEELGAVIKTADVISLGAISEAETNYSELVYLYFWHDKHGTITGCYEGTAKYYRNPDQAMAHPKIMEDVKWLLHLCKKKNLL